MCCVMSMKHFTCYTINLDKFVRPAHTKSILSIVGVESEGRLINEMGKVP